MVCIGPVMAVRESPSKPHHKFVEFFDVRDAARALSELNGREVGGGVRLLVEFTRPCDSGHPRRCSVIVAVVNFKPFLLFVILQLLFQLSTASSEEEA